LVDVAVILRDCSLFKKRKHAQFLDLPKPQI
jgi:hypothetical protein